MKLQHLHYLLVINAHHSISSAARELYISQTALSAVLGRVEEELGFPIFTRSRSGVFPTEDGKEVLSIAWEIWRQQEVALSINYQDGNSLTPLNIISSPSINCGLTVPLVRAFRRREPLGHIIFHENTSNAIGHLIAQNCANIGLAYFDKKDLKDFIAFSHKQRLNISYLFHDQLFLVVRKESPLSALERISVSEIQNRCFAVLPQFSLETPELYAQFLGTNNRLTVLPSVPHIKQAILDWDACGVLSSFAFKQDKSVNNEDLRAIPLIAPETEQCLSLCLIHLRISGLNHREQVLLQCIHEFFDDLAKDESAS